MKKYILSIVLLIIFTIGVSTLIRSGFETDYDRYTSFPINEYRRKIGLIVTSISGFFTVV